MAEPTWIVLLAALAATAACDRDAPSEPESDCNPSGMHRLCAEGDATACRWASIYDGRAEAAAIAEVTGGAGDDLDSALTALVPELAGKTLVDDSLETPDPPLVEILSDPPYQLELPVDWNARPDASRTWRLYYQSLSWLSPLCDGDGDDAALDTALYVLTDWAERAQYLEPPLENSWDDHALAIRLSRTAECLEQYVARRDVLDRRVVQALSSIVLTHLYALAEEACYVPRHNHGVIQDLALLSNVRRYPALVDGPALWDLAGARMDDQVIAAVSVDGIHRENSPAYHVLFLGVLSAAIDVYQQWNQTPSPLVTGARDQLLESVIYQFQPDFTLPQFGDTENDQKHRQVSRLLSTARAQAVGDPAIYDQLEWVLTDGVTGTMPVDVDRVFAEGGYAAFRSAWDPANPRDQITGHFKCTRETSIHYHRDETSFELYGYGQELIVDSGKFSYDRADPMVVYQYDVHAHNVLTVDHQTYPLTGRPRLVAQGSADGLAWVQGGHRQWADLGVSTLVRTFAHAKPATFVVVDHVQAEGDHAYAQHFHLHPTLSEITVVGDSVVATVPGGNGPTVVLTPQQPPTAIRQLRGGEADRINQGWYFFGWHDAEPTTDVIFRYERGGGELDFPVLITLSGPGEPARIPSAVTYAETSDELQVGWTVLDDSQALSIPLPPEP